jgi:hypothetical protein
MWLQMGKSRFISQDGKIWKDEKRNKALNHDVQRDNLKWPT